MEAILLPHLPEHPLRVCLFKDVKNASFLRKQLLEGNTEFEYAFLDATALISRNHILAACFRAINDQLNNRLKSRNVHSEIVFSLSPNNNVSGYFKSSTTLSSMLSRPSLHCCYNPLTPSVLTPLRSQSPSAASASKTAQPTSWPSKSVTRQSRFDPIFYSTSKGHTWSSQMARSLECAMQRRQRRPTKSTYQTARRRHGGKQKRSYSAQWR